MKQNTLFWGLWPLLGLAAPLCQAQSLDTQAEWEQLMAFSENTRALQEFSIGGRADLMGNGALMLEKADQGKPFWKTSVFQSQGNWTSQWLEGPAQEIGLSWIVYGQKQDMSQDWVKFAGNPLVAAYNWKHNRVSTLALPEDYSDQPADQSLVKGAGLYEGKWLLFFNIGGWAVKGWGMALADSLAPLKSGKNPFRLAEPYPLTQATGGFNAPNDWIFVDSLWYAPDESRDHVSRMWTSQDLKYWVLRGDIRGMNGHDPGMAWDGENYYLFNEANEQITLVYATDPLGEWKTWEGSQEGAVLDVKDHTGDADLAFFNNAWHMFVDDGAHRKYKLSYARTQAEDFPLGWQLQAEVFGPHQPEQNQLWDDADEQGNNFGTGDADIALEGHTLYLTYEWPIGIAYKNLELMDGREQSLQIRIDYKKGKKIVHSPWIKLAPGESTLRFQDFGFNLAVGQAWRLHIEMETQNPQESPLVEWLKIK